jgi:GntR family transcriptional repressor for pyruvate dehydrogenase complex
LIAEGEYQPGMKLPTERVLAKQWNVGRPAVREAIKALSILDVLESRRGDGTYVKSLAGLSIGWPAKMSGFEPDFDMLELLEVRKMIEPRAAGLAAVRASERQLQGIKQQMVELEANARKRHLIAKSDYLFHDSIIRASGNRILIELHHFLSSRLMKSREITARTAPDMSKMFRDHAAIFEAIVRGQSDLAEKAMLEHLHTVGLDLISARRS